MTERSHVARRADRVIDRDFPLLPTLSGTMPCDGLAFVLRPGAPVPDLRAQRDMIGALWRGDLVPHAGPSDAHAPTLVVVLFRARMPVDMARWPAALPLRAAAGATLASYAEEAFAPAVEVRTMSAPAARWLALWWNGRLHRIALDMLEPLPLVDLWDMPALTVHWPPPPVAADAQADGDAHAGPGLADPGQAIAGADGLAPVSRPEALVTRDGARLLDGMTAALRGTNAAAERGLGAGIRRLLSGLSGWVTRTGGIGEGTGTAGHGGAPLPRGPGLLERFSGWLRWNTPLGSALREQFGDRLNQVEKLIASGDIDAALRLALKLSDARRRASARSVLPTHLPPMRAALDFSVGGLEIASPILGGDSFHALSRRYRELAAALERDGDFRRAAYIHSQLLGDHQRAVIVLESGGLFGDAARLALDANLDPALAIRMLFLAGELDAALAHARRTGCFDQLAEDSRTKDGRFHAYVIKAWTDMLIATGHPLRALQVTDDLAKAPDVAALLLSARRRWLTAALRVEEANGFGCEAVCRALLLATWTAEDLPPAALADFPFGAAIGGAGPFPAALAWLQTVMRGDAEDAADRLLELLAGLTRLADADRVDQAAFWREAAQPVVEGLTRALIEHASSRLREADLQALRGVLVMADLPVLAADIHKLRKLHVAPVAPDRTWRVPPVTSMRPAVRCACLLDNGTMLVWRESRLLQLVDRHGSPLWQANVGDVVALVAIGNSPNVIVVQADRDGTSMLTRFASHQRRFHPIGRIALAAHHDLATEGEWLVQIGGDIGALDLVKLCAATPEIAFLWSCALTDRLRAIAFAHHRGGPRWLTRDDGTGVLESWTLSARGTLSTELCLPVSLAADAPLVPPAEWCWFVNHGGNRLHSIGESRRWMTLVAWSAQTEAHARHYAARRAAAGLEGQDGIQPCDFGRVHVGRPVAGDDPDAIVETIIARPDAAQPSMTLRHRADTVLTCLARGGYEPDATDAKPRQPGPARGDVVLGDAFGRLFVVAAGDSRVTMIES